MHDVSGATSIHERTIPWYWIVIGLIVLLICAMFISSYMLYKYCRKRVSCFNENFNVSKRLMRNLRI